MEMKGIILLSGGVDSATLALSLIKEGWDLTGIFFDYGQANMEITKNKATLFALANHIPLRFMKLPLKWSGASVIGRNFVKEGINTANLYDKDVKRLSWVPARNTMMLATAGAYASEFGFEYVFCAFQLDEPEWRLYDSIRTNKAIFPATDITPSFIDKMNDLSAYMYKTLVKFIAPYLDKRLTSDEIVDIGYDLGLNMKKYTYSCRYFPKCGECEQCVIRKRRLYKR